MGATPRGFVYPASTDVPDVPSDMQALAESIDDYIGTMYACYVYQTAVTSISGSATTVLFDTELFDSASMHSTSSNTGRITAPVDGLYSVDAMVAFASNATGYRDITVNRNGTAYLRDRSPAISGISTIARCSGLITMTAGQYLEVAALQNSGGNLDTVTGASWTKFIVARIGDAV